MSTPFIGEIRMFGGNFAPVGWAFCDGQLLPISENDALFALLGTTYGGDGQETFALPDLRSRVPVHSGQGPGHVSRQLGEQAGVEQVTLTVNQLPAHSHAMSASTAAGTTASPAGQAIGASPNVRLFRPVAATLGMNPAAVAPSGGGSQPHDNMMPFLCINFIISLFGVFPQQN